MTALSIPSVLKTQATSSKNNVGYVQKYITRAFLFAYVFYNLVVYS